LRNWRRRRRGRRQGGFFGVEGARRFLASRRGAERFFERRNARVAYGADEVVLVDLNNDRN